MATSSQSANASQQSPDAADNAPDAIALLTQDHQKVKEMFEQYEALSDRSLASKRKLALAICLELTKHATAEEEIFYPAVREASRKNADLVDEATVEHASAKDLIAQIVAMEPGEDLYDAKIKVLSEQIEHHVQEEEEEMFPKARDARLDLQSLGAEIAARKAQIDLPDMQSH
ncbi:hemerythrin domain-containing protein [Janthinobacterium sp. RB2R34]|uniref:hemerythrin domain-containing protein n=1 Tax=Janthinobacterium sp. RB2R34 TaxID=3424193 RepID=UPI003F282C35